MYPPSGRRRGWLALVAACPCCGYAHAHRADRWDALAGELRRGSCGALYRVHVDTLALDLGRAA